MWDLPGPGIEPMSPALAGGFLTIVPPGKSQHNCFYFYYFFIFWPHRAACGILVPQPGVRPGPPALEVWSLNHWTTREVPDLIVFNSLICTMRCPKLIYISHLGAGVYHFSIGTYFFLLEISSILTLGVFIAPDCY